MKHIRRIVAVMMALVIIGFSSHEALAVSIGRRFNEDRFTELKNREITVHWEMVGWYKAQFIKLYGREVIGIDENNKPILGAWKLLDEKDTAYCGDENEMTLPATYHEFAFSYDIVWGTDFPFSNVIYSVMDEDVSRIDISMGGSVRSAVFRVDTPEYGNAFTNVNCEAHSEWKP